MLDDKGVEVQPSAPKVCTLLALLLLNRGQPVRADTITDTLWADAPPQWAPNLVHGYVRDLRRGTASKGSLRSREVTGSTFREAGVDAFPVRGPRPGSAVRRGAGILKRSALLEWADQPWARGGSPPDWRRSVSAGYWSPA